MIKPTSETIHLGPKLKISEDKRHKTKSTFLPFDFLDGTKGAIIITKFTTEPWTPNEDIPAITIHYEDLDTVAKDIYKMVVDKELKDTDKLIKILSEEDENTTTRE